MEKAEKDLSYKVEALEKDVKKLEQKQESGEQILSEIRIGFNTIKEALTYNREQEDLKNQLIVKDIEGMKERTNKLEANQRWLVLATISELLGLVFGIIMNFINKGL